MTVAFFGCGFCDFCVFNLRVWDGNRDSIG